VANILFAFFTGTRPYAECGRLFVHCDDTEFIHDCPGGSLSGGSRFTARLAGYLSPDLSQPLGAFIVFVSLTALAVLLLSNRLRRKLRLFVTSHFKRPVYDYRRVWMDLNKRTTSLVGAAELSTAVCRMVSDSLEILSVNVWLVDESQRS
jgi:hypothetical protein